MRALVLGAAGGLLAVAFLTPWTAAALDELADARAKQANLAADASAPAVPAIIRPDLAIAASNRATAVTALATRIRDAAGKGGVLVEGMEGVAGNDAVARVRVRLSGSEGAVLGLADTLERASPLTRFVHWRVEARGGSVLLTGELVAPWA